MFSLFLTYGTEPRGAPSVLAPTSNPAASDFIQNIHTAVQTAQRATIRTNEYTTIQANRHRRPSTFGVGYIVLLSTRNIVSDTYTGARKLMPKFCGPFSITAQINDVTYRLDLSAPMIARGTHNAFHAKLLRPYHSDPGFERTPRPLFPFNSLTATLSMRLTNSFVSASIAGNRSIWFIGKAMAVTKFMGAGR
jgi:hypothetical protein